MNNTLLITLGCSWTYGVGAGYRETMEEDGYNKHIRWDSNLCWENGWRKQVVDYFNVDHLNFAVGGSSNDRQFRHARDFFSSNTWNRLLKSDRKIVVLWGTTSISRKYFWCNDVQGYRNIFLVPDEIKVKSLKQIFAIKGGKEYEDKITVAYTKWSYNYQEELKELERNIKFWNNYFETINIKNFWFDTFDSHQYKNIPTNMFGHSNRGRRDMLHVICKNYDENYDKKINSDAVFTYAVDKKLLNPYSFHPTKNSYKCIGNYMINQLKEELDN